MKFVLHFILLTLLAAFRRPLALEPIPPRGLWPSAAGHHAQTHFCHYAPLRLTIVVEVGVDRRSGNGVRADRPGNLCGHVRGLDCGANREAGAQSDAGALRLGGADSYSQPEPSG